MQEGLGDHGNADELLDILRGADTDNSGIINYTEFLAAAMNATTYLRESNLQTAFEKFDVDGNGKIDRSELR